MVEGVNVKFRWFRTIETTANTIELVSPSRAWDAVDLIWDSLKLVYESGPTYMICGKHKGSLVIADRRFRCEQFTIVPTTLEVNVFVRDNDETSREPYNDQNPGLKRKSDEISPFFNINRNNSLLVLSDSVSVASSRSVNVYEEMLDAKDDEIGDLQLQLDQLKLALVETEAENSKLRSLKSDNDFAFEASNVSFDLEARKPVNDNDPTEIDELLDEMRNLRNRLHSYSRKNKELCKEMFKLRAENIKLQAERLRNPRFQLKSTDTVYYSDPESNSTQYRELPLMRLSRSLPDTLGETKKPVLSFRRRPIMNIGCGDDSPLSVDSLQTDDFVSYGTPRKVVSAVQTDITALKGTPKRYRSGSNVQVRRALFDDICIEEKQQTKYRSKDENDDSEDTDELLQEADRFIMKIYSKDMESIIEQHNSGFSNSKVKISSSTLSVPCNNSSSRSNRSNVRPFLPKCALDLKIGYKVRYLGPTGRVSQGIVTFIGPISGKVGTFIGIEGDRGVENSYLSSTPCANFVPFKKVILAWENCFN